MKRCHTKAKVRYDDWRTNPESCRFDNMCTSFYEITDLAANVDEKFSVVIEMINDMKKKLESKKDSCENQRQMANLKQKASTTEEVNGAKESHIADPEIVRSKGRPPFKRKQSKIE